MTIIRIQHTLQGVSGTAEDRFVNNWYVAGVGVPDFTTLDSIAQGLREFYGDDGIGPYMSQAAAAIGRSIRMYDLNDAIPRVPIYESIDSTAPWGNLGANCLPNEVALCLSFEAVQVSGQPQARKRGRVYIGPFSNGALLATPTPPQSRPKTELITAMITNASDFGALCTGLSFPWSVYSPTNLTAFPVHRLWVDNAWDTQRRRGIDATAMTDHVFA